MTAKNRKYVHDPIHGSIVIDGLFLDLMGRHEIQRLHSIKQLGLGNMVFPGANHTRFEHSLGVYHLAGRMCEALDLDKDDTLALKTAGFLHDICHPPFSHTLEELMEMITEKDHMDLARDLISGKIQTFMDRDHDMFGGTEPIGTCEVGVTDKGIQKGFGRSPEQVVLHVFKIPSVVLRLLYKRIEDKLLAVTLMGQEPLLLQNLHKGLHRIICRLGLRQALQHIIHAAVAHLPDHIHHLLLSI